MIRALAKKLIGYSPLDETLEVRQMLAEGRVEGRPYCADHQGDLMYRLIREHGFEHCLQIGFGTGSTALYMLAAVEKSGGAVCSVDWSESNFNELGRRRVESSRFAASHILVEKPSHVALPELLSEGRRYDFVFLDGWKTFDYLVGS